MTLAIIGLKVSLSYTQRPLFYSFIDFLSEKNNTLVYNMMDLTIVL